MKQFKSFGLVVVTLLFSSNYGIRRKTEYSYSCYGRNHRGYGKLGYRNPVIRQDKLPSVHCSTLCLKLKTSPT